MKKIITVIATVTFAIVLFLMIDPLYIWIKGGEFEINRGDLRLAIFLAIITALLPIVSNRIKSSGLFVVLAICIAVALYFVLQLIIPA